MPNDILKFLFALTFHPFPVHLEFYRILVPFGYVHSCKGPKVPCSKGHRREILYLQSDGFCPFRQVDLEANQSVTRRLPMSCCFCCLCILSQSDGLSDQFIQDCELKRKPRKGKDAQAALNIEADQRKPRRKDTPVPHAPPFRPGKGHESARSPVKGTRLSLGHIGPAICFS